MASWPEAVAGAAAAAFAAAWGAGLWEASRLVTRHLSFTVSSDGLWPVPPGKGPLPPGEGGHEEGRPTGRVALRVVQLSDLHLHRRPGRSHRLALEALAELRPQLAVVTGDLVDGASRPGVAERFVEELAALARTVVVWGNHDHDRSDLMGPLRERLEARGGWVLVNRRVELVSRGLSLQLVGVDTPDLRLDRCRQAIERAPVAQARWDDEAGRWVQGTALSGWDGPEDAGSGPVATARLIAAHTYHVVDHDEGCTHGALVLAGDTHGGQVVLPLLGPVWARWVHHHRYVEGLHRVGSAWLYVNRGLGTIGVPVRLRCPPELTVVDLMVSHAT
ncbi:metallophosphoesterase [Carboxydochorda subterranea]|uniref:Metallophosphoesterase n=1 Tax=Carboxydichorda subterranea TaxID=3109565 RepID=A0ABZ1C1H0_9FIRM|nr:metallophosphoesterase [Limnochorda sp. L945t]WRP18956.1 metallophosphoesterase [Limnochorda sp. L945t]